jgi:hypothetical protein
MAISDEYLKDLEKQDQQRKAESLANVYSNNVKPVTTYDPSGNFTQGYLIDNKTYLDPRGTQRLPVGYTSIVNNKAYLMTDNGGQYLYDLPSAQQIQAATSTPANTNIGESYLSRLYDAQTQAQKAALESAYQQNLNTLQAQRAQVPQQYETARNQAAAQSEVERQRWNEYAAATGLNAGASGQAQLSFSNLLQSNLANINRAQADALAQLDLQVAQLQTQYKNDVAKAIAEGDFAKAQALYNNYQAERDRMIQQQQYVSNLAYNYATLDRLRENDAYSRESNEYERNYSIALTAAQSSGDFSGMAAFGWTPEQISSARQEWIRQRTPVSAGAPKAEKPNLSPQQAVDAYLKGITTPEVLSALVYYYGTQDLDGLISTPQPETPTANPIGINSIADMVTNKVDTRSDGKDWITVAGYGRLTWDELYNLVERGEIEEVYNPQTGKYTYRKKSGSNNGSGGKTDTTTFSIR